MKTKKEILKKYVGKGGPLSPFRAVRDMVVKGGAGVAKSIGSGIGKGVRAMMAPSIRVNKLEKERDDKWRQEGEDMMAGRERYVPDQKTLNSRIPDQKPKLQKIIKRNEIPYKVIAQRDPSVLSK